MVQSQLDDIPQCFTKCFTLGDRAVDFRIKRNERDLTKGSGRSDEKVEIEQRQLHIFVLPSD